MARRLDTLRICAVILLFASVVYFYLNLFSPKSIPYFLRFWPLPSNMNILIMGSDIVYDKVHHVAIKEMGHTDTMILVSVNTNSFKVNMLSIPRDTVVEIPGYGWQKINAAYYLGGAELAKETVGKFLGVKVNNYVVVNTKGLVKLINLMGGVRVYVDKDMYYVDNWGGLKIDLKQGWQTLNGEQAHGFIRYRQDPLGDVTRVQRQQSFLQTVLRKLATPSMLAKAPWVLALAFESIKTDLSLKEILYTLNFARGLRKEDVDMTMVPGSFSEEENGSGWQADMDALKDIVNKYFSKRFLAKLEPHRVPSTAVTIINNSQDFDAVRQIMKLLYRKEYAITNVSSLKKPGVNRSEVIAQKGDRTGAQRLASIVGIKDVVVSGTGDIQSDFTIIVCDDWKELIEKKLNR